MINELFQLVQFVFSDKENFRVYILVPLLPGFEGDVGTPGGSALTAVLNWTYLSLSRGPNSLLENLKKVVPDPMKYISVNSLRTYDILCGKLVSFIFCIFLAFYFSYFYLFNYSFTKLSSIIKPDIFIKLDKFSWDNEI